MENKSNQTGMYIIDKDYKMIYVNPTTQELYPEVNVGDICYKVLACGDAPCQHCPIGRSESMFYNPVRKEWITAQAAEIMIPGQDLCYDIHFQMKQRQTGTRESLKEHMDLEEHIISLNGVTGDACIIGGYCEPGFPLFHVNNNMIHMLGYETEAEFEDAIDGLVINTIHPDDRAQVAKDLGDSYYPGMTYETVYRMPRKDGSWIWTVDKGKVLETESGRLAIISVCMDMTGYSRRQKLLADHTAELEKHYDMTNVMMNNMPSGYHRCAAKPGFPFIFIGEHFENIVGWTKDEIAEEFDNLFENLIWPEDKETAGTYNDMMNMKGKGNSYSTDIYRMKRKGGGYRWVLDSTMFVDMGEDSFFQATIADITEFIEAQNDQKNKLKEAMVRVEEANNAKTQFLSSMSHDIRTPMNAIIGMTTLASKHLEDKEYMKKCLGKMTLASRHLLTLINDVLDISKVESGKMALNPIVFSLSDTVTNLVNIVRQQIMDKGHQFNVRVHNIDTEYLFADELRLNQIFINILSNAVKYTPDGGCIWMDIWEETIPERPNMVRVIYTVEDTGIGMSKEFQEYMYNSFVREDDKNYGNMQGTGLGLTISKRMIDLMDGKIECESETGKGTKFTVTLELPIAEKLLEDMILPPMDTLLVDDDIVFLESAADTLRKMNITPYCVTNGADAIAAAVERHQKGNDYPVIIVDWKMPDMDGIETIRRIRAQVGDEVSIIVVSAYEWEEIGLEAMEAGANGFISKPFFPSSVYENMVEILGLAQREKENGNDITEGYSGMNILVAEDNDINWEIANELLGMYQITSVRAENGQRCVEMLEAAKPGEYDLVLMDIRMPVLDGYGATQAIRQSELEHVKKIPIVAMTADAFSDDIQKCMDCGMNGHIAKPISISNLLAVLGHLIGGGGTSIFTLKSITANKDK